jgi:hypothetical protein
MKHLFTEYDRETGFVHEFGYQDGKLVERTTQDVEPHLEYSTKLRNAPEYAKQGIKDNLQHIAHIPNVLILKWMVEEGFDAHKAHPSELLAKLRKERSTYEKVLVTDGRF